MAMSGSALTNLDHQAKILGMMNSRQDDPLQSSSLSTYIGYITGPRAEQPVGVRVVEPPPGTRQHQRGSLYIVIEVSGDHPDRAAIADRLLSEVQRVYYSAKGSQSQVMVEAIQQTQQLLREINAHTPHYPMHLGIMCAALLGGKLLVASSGAAFALLRVNDRVHMFPSDPSTTVGGYGTAPVEVYRQDVSADDVLFLGGGGWLRRVATRTLASIVAFTNADNCTEAADELFDQAGQAALPGLLIVLGTNYEPPRPSGYGGGGYPSGSSSGPSGGMPAGPAPRRPRFGGLPTALSTSPPARMPPSTPLSNLSPPSTPTLSSSSSPPSALSSSVSPRVSRSEWELPPTQIMSSGAAPKVELPPPSAPSAMVDEPLVETPLRQTHSLETANIDTPNIDTTNLDSAAKELQTRQPQGVEPVRADSHAPSIEGAAGSDLPVEPGDEFDPIFPPSTTLERQEAIHTGPNWLKRWQDQAILRMSQARSFLGRMLPEHSRDREMELAWDELPDEAETPRPKLVPPRHNEMEGGLAASSVREPPPRREQRAPVEPMLDEGTADVTAPPVVPVLEMSPFAPPPPTRGARARLFLLAALVIVILVPVVVAAINLGQGNTRRAEAEQLTARAEIVLLGAQSALDQGDKEIARERLTEAQDYLAQAIALDGTNENRTQLIATIESELQQVLQVMPLYGLTEPLITFPTDARPQHVLVMNEDIFIIDAGRQALMQYRFDPSSETVTDQVGQVILSQGDVIDGVSVGTLADLAWLPLIPGYEDRPSLLITDRNNNVFRYDQRVEGATLMQVADRSSWGSIGQVQTFNGRVYIADEAKGAILRYDPGRFEAAGESWFSPETQVNLAGLLSMEIDGDIWLLFSNGMILRYRERQQVPFSPENSIGLAEEPVDMYVTRQESAYIYVVDAGQDRILVYEKSGTYVGQLRAPEDDLLRGLSGLYIDEVSRVMYILTQTGLFAHPVLP
jgi:hypothetical protein